MIDKKNSFVELASDNIVKPSMSLDELLRMKLGESQEERDMRIGWIRYTVRNVKVVDQYFIISFSFHDNKLKELSLVFSDSKFDISKGWEFWSEKEERQNVVKFNNWLNAEIGSERSFNWGEIWPEYDTKGGSSHIGIRYKN